MQPIIIAPDDAVLVDERVSVTIKHLQPLQRCTIRAELRSEKNEIFESFGQFIANSSGEVNPEKDSSFGGTYVGSGWHGLVLEHGAGIWSAKRPKVHCKKFALTDEVPFAAF